MPGVISLSDFENSEDEDVQFIRQVEPMKCQFCDIPLHKFSVGMRQEHYDRHLSDSQKSGQGSSSKEAGNTFKSSTPFFKLYLGKKPRPQATPEDKENVFWFPAKTEPPPSNFTPGLIPVLKRTLAKTHARGQTTRAVLCHAATTHIATERWDMGWGCGYRNFLMACTALMTQQFQPLYFPLLDDPSRPPGVRNLQYWIEDAWADGFDREGASQLKHKLIGTRKWIGTAELYVAFTNRGIPARLVDFPGSERGPVAVTQWVINYFSPKDSGKPSNAFAAINGASPIIVSERMPLILQHAGHSRTIVGYELNKKGDPNLLIFDPSYRLNKDLRRVALATHSPSLVDPSSKPSSYLSIFSKDLKRRNSDVSFKENGHIHKRVRGGKEVEQSANDQIIVIGSDGDSDSEAGKEQKNTSLEDLDPVKILNVFRVNLSKLGKHDRYQILYFDLVSPLENNERWSRRVVTSERVV